MSEPSSPDLIKVTEIFLVPSSFLVAALGTADTNLHRAAVSLLGAIISGLWLFCSQDAYREAAASHAEHGGSLRRRQTLVRLPLVFGIGWLLALAVHLALAGRPLGS